ncbi:hypothetical protein AB0J51_19000 [Micromonospora echinofusca]|uniref:hypothetical protein n=1 Tax=Micromonospora echinofusca TaxID=47858 RepID=UPI003445894C
MSGRVGRWLGAACGGWLVVLGRDTIEGMLSFIGLLWLVVFATVALVLTAVAAVARRAIGEGHDRHGVGGVPGASSSCWRCNTFRTARYLTRPLRP